MATLLIPSSLQLAGWLGVFFAGAVLIGLGRMLTAGRAAPEAALIGGWGAAALLLTLWGVLFQAGLRLPAIALAILGIAGLLWPGLRLVRGEWASIGRV